MAASALTMTQQAYANPCSITENGEDKAVTDEGTLGDSNAGSIGCTFNDEVITFEPTRAQPSSAIEHTSLPHFFLIFCCIISK